MDKLKFKSMTVLMIVAVITYICALSWNNTFQLAIKKLVKTDNELAASAGYALAASMLAIATIYAGLTIVPGLSR